MNSGSEELSSTALTAVVLRRPRYTRLWNTRDAGEREQQQDAGVAPQQRPLPRSAGQARTARARAAATSQRQKFSVTGSKASRSARPAIQLPDQSRLREREQQEGLQPGTWHAGRLH